MSRLIGFLMLASLLSWCPAARADPDGSLKVIARLVSDSHDEFTRDDRASFEEFLGKEEDEDVLADTEAQAYRVLRPGRYLLLRVYQPDSEGNPQPVSPAAAKLQKISYELDGKEVPTLPVPPAVLGTTKTFLIVEVPSVVTEHASHGSRVKVTMTFADHVEARYTEYNASPQLYGATGFWLPVGLFSSNLDQTDQGMVFAVHPINLAWGGRVITGKSFHLGLSVAGGWAITSRNADDPTVSGGTNGGFTLKSASGSLLLDVGSWFYLGGSYLADLQEHVNDPGFALTVGFGPKLLGAAAGVGD